MNTKCIIIHGCPSDAKKAIDPKTRTYDKHWIPWTKQQLEERGIKTETPLMPKPWQPVYNYFKAEFEKLEIDENTILVGHSCGCAFLIRWLGESKKEISKLFLVAPWKIEDDASDLKKAFYNFSIDRTIRDRVQKIFMFTSDNEEENGKRGLKIFHEALGGEIISLDNHGHYTMNGMETEEFPESIDKIIE